MPHLFSPAKPAPHFIPRDACCAPPARVPATLAPARRTKLAELDANIHCSIIGTCLSTSELRKLVARYVPDLARKDAFDVEIHHTAVNLSTEGGVVAKELNKALDTRHALAIKKFRAAGNERALKLLWQEAMAQGDVPGAYWALMTHPASTFDLRTVAFGDVHMLSHLVGASNRADIRRLAALEEETTRLKEQNASQQARIQALVAQQAATHDTLQELQAVRHVAPPVLEDVAQLRAALAERDARLALHTTRRSEAEQARDAQQAHQQGLQAELDAVRAAMATAHGELAALEATLSAAFLDDAGKPALPHLDGKRVLYVGGRPGSSQTLVRLVAAAGGELLVHDGGIEDRHGLLATMLARADLVVFPIDCISHNAMHVAKQACARQNIACHPLRSASVASFVALMQRLAEPSFTQ
jgi:hypothetical protein